MAISNGPPTRGAGRVGVLKNPYRGENSGVNLPKDIQFGFKGGRDYVHGPDIYSAIRDRVFDEPPEEIVSLNMHHLLRGDACLVELSSEADDIASEVVVGINGKEKSFGIRPAGAASMPIRAYAEDEIASAGVLTLDGGRLENSTGFDSIEEAVALIKAWSNRFQPIFGRWVVAKIASIDGSPPLPASRNGVLGISRAGGIAKKLNRFEVTCDGVAAMVFFGARG